MERKEIRILIVEDDATVGASLAQVLAREGLRADHFARPDDAEKSARINTYQLAVVDCLLPKLNGVDFSIKLKESTGPDIRIVLMSGIFKEKGFIKDAVAKCKAVAFLQKPFDNDSFAQCVEQSLEGLIDEPKSPLFELLTNPQLKTREVIKFIETIENASGFELPLIFSSIMEARLSGHLNLVDEQGMISGVSFCNGMIQKVDIPDTKTFLGELLVEKGFLSASDLGEITRTQNERRIGQRLVDSNLLSPHALPIAMREQMSLRLSMTIDPNQVQINFVQSDVPMWEPSLSQAEVIPYLSDWLQSKFKIDWLKSYYLEWMDHKLQYGASSSELIRIPAVAAIFSKLPNLIDELLTAENLAAAVEKHKDKEDEFYRALHFLIVTRRICFNPRKVAMSWENHHSRLVRIQQQLQGKDHLEVFEVFGLSSRARPAEIQQLYRELTKILHPDKLGPGAPTETAKLATEVMSQITSAYKIMTDEAARARYLRDIEVKKTQKFLDAENKYEEGKLHLRRGLTAKAAALFKECTAIMENNSEASLYYLWAQIKLIESGEINNSELKSIESGLTKIPPEDRHNATFYLVKGLFEKAQGNIDLAVRNFELAYQANPSFLEAKRELKLATNQAGSMNDEKTGINADLGTFIGKLFKK